MKKVIRREDAEALLALLLERVWDEVPARMTPVMLALTRRSASWGAAEQAEWEAAVDALVAELLAEHLAELDALSVEIPIEPGLQ